VDPKIPTALVLNLKEFRQMKRIQDTCCALGSCNSKQTACRGGVPGCAIGHHAGTAIWLRLQVRQVSSLYPFNAKCLLEKLTTGKLVRKYLAYCGSRRFITVFKTSCNWSLSCTHCISGVATTRQVHTTGMACQEQFSRSLHVHETDRERRFEIL